MHYESDSGLQKVPKSLAFLAFSCHLALYHLQTQVQGGCRQTAFIKLASPPARGQHMAVFKADIVAIKRLSRDVGKGRCMQIKQQTYLRQRDRLALCNSSFHCKIAESPTPSLQASTTPDSSMKYDWSTLLVHD